MMNVSLEGSYADLASLCVVKFISFIFANTSSATRVIIEYAALVVSFSKATEDFARPTKSNSSIG